MSRPSSILSDDEKQIEIARIFGWCSVQQGLTTTHLEKLYINPSWLDAILLGRGKPDEDVLEGSGARHVTVTFLANEAGIALLPKIEFI